MQFLHHEEAGAERLTIDGEAYRYLFRVRRLRSDDTIHLRNLRDDGLYSYRIRSLDRRRVEIALESVRELRIAPKWFLRLHWCLIDPKTIEKALPTLNEIGVSEIRFLKCDRSQRNFRLDFDRLRRILINSSQQCGRSVMMTLEEGGEISEVPAQDPKALLLDFSERALSCEGRIESLVVGPEGGFTGRERALFPDERIVGFDTPTILRSESAVCAAASRVLL